MNSIGLSRAVITGHSMGGAVALTMALDYPERVAGIGLISSGARLPISQSILDLTTNPDTFQFASQTITQLAFSRQAKSSVKELAAKHLAKSRPALLHGDFLACDSFDVTNRLHEIQTPTLIICSTEDRVTPLKYSVTLANQIYGATLQTVHRAGHMVMLEQPRRVSGLLSLFMTTVPYQPGM